SACDTDGLADGVCTFPLQACLGVDPTCGATTVSSARVSPKKLPASATLAASIQALAAGQCSAPGFTVPVKWKPGTPGPIKRGKAKLRTIVAAGGKKDVDVLTFTCEPAQPALSSVVQPLLSSHCATAGCHGGITAQVPHLDAGVAHGSLVGMTATESKLPYV